MSVREKRGRIMLERAQGIPSSSASSNKGNGLRQDNASPAAPAGRDGGKSAAAAAAAPAGGGGGGGSAGGSAIKASRDADDAASSDDEADSVPAGPLTESDARADADAAPPKKAARVRQGNDDDEPARSASDLALNAKLQADIKRQEGESLKDYKIRLKRESNRIIKVSCWQCWRRQEAEDRVWRNQNVMGPLCCLLAGWLVLSFRSGHQ